MEMMGLHGCEDGGGFVSCRKMLKLCGDTEERLAQELILFELEIERDVVEPLYVLAEVNTPLSLTSTTLNFIACPNM